MGWDRHNLCVLRLRPDDLGDLTGYPKAPSASEPHPRAGSMRLLSLEGASLTYTSIRMNSLGPGFHATPAELIANRRYSTAPRTRSYSHARDRSSDGGKRERWLLKQAPRSAPAKKRNRRG